MSQLIEPNVKRRKHIVIDEQGNRGKEYDVKITQDEMNISDSVVEAGDLAREISKYYHSSLMKSINEHRKFNREKLYFFVRIARNPYNKNEFHLKIAVHDQRINKLIENSDYFSYNYKNEKLKALWAIPHKNMMKNYLNEPEKYNRLVIESIRKFLKQENLDLDKLRRTRIL